MSLSKGTVLVLMTMLMAFLKVSAVQDNNSDVDWYESFFQEKKQDSAEKALALGASKLQAAIARQDMPSVAKALNEMGLIHLTRTYDYDKAMDFLIQALAIEDSLKLNDKQIFSYLAIAQVFEEVSDYYNSAQVLKIALHLNEPLKNVTVRAFILNELGKIHASMGKIDTAFENYQQVLAYKDVIKKPRVEAEALFNLAHLYRLQGKYDESLRNHKLALVIRRSINDKKNEALSLNDIGELYQLMRNDEKAMANHTVALEIRQALKDERGVAESFNNIGSLYHKQKNFQRAVTNLHLALDAGRRSQSQDQLLRSYEYLSECYEALGDFKKALEYKGLFFKINEFMQANKSEQQLLETQNRYVIGQREAQIAKFETDRVLREKEINDQKRFGNILLVIVALSLIIVVLVFYFYKLQQRSNKSLKAAHTKVNQQNLELHDLNATKDKFFSIISHDLKGPLNSLTSFSSLLINHTESLSKEEIKMFAQDFDKSLKNLFALLENLLEWSRSQTGNIEFTPETFDVASLLEENKELLKAQAQQKKITLCNDHTEKIIIHAHKNSINTTVRNLISNAIKFTPEEGKISLGIAQLDGEVIVSVEDTGVGMSQDVILKLFRIDSKHSTKGTANEKGTGLGLILCKEFIEKNGGKLWVTSKEGEGSKFYFSLPLAPKV